MCVIYMLTYFPPDIHATRRRLNTGPCARDTVRMAYEFALKHIGHDRESSEIWTDYIQFLKSGEVSNEVLRRPATNAQLAIEHMGGRTEDRRGAESIPARGSNTYG